MNDTASHWLACSAALLMTLKEVTTFQPSWLAAAFSASSVVAVTADDGRVAIQQPPLEQVDARRIVAESYPSRTTGRHWGRNGLRADV